VEGVVLFPEILGKFGFLLLLGKFQQGGKSLARRMGM